MGIETDMSTWIDWPDPKTGQPYLYLNVRWRLVRNRWECVGLDIQFANDPNRPLRTTDLRKIKLSDVLERASSELQDRLTAMRGSGHDGPYERLVDDLVDAAPRQSGRPPVATDTLREVARVYSEAQQRGEHPTEAVRRTFGIKKSRAARWVWLCRQPKHGLLPPTRQGMARGSQPPKPEEDE